MLYNILKNQQAAAPAPPPTKTILKKPPAPLKNRTKAPAIAGHCARLSEISAGINFLHIAALSEFRSTLQAKERPK